MAKFEEGQCVYVPARLLPKGDDEIFAIVRRKIARIEDRSIILEHGNKLLDPIASSKAYSDLGIAVISIGDFQSETGLITPLAKSVVQFCRLLVPDDHLKYDMLRSLAELKQWWSRYQGAYTHIILIGHGDKNCIAFGVDGECTPAAIAEAIGDTGESKKMFISLCCQTGKAPFAEAFSKLPFVGHFVAPEHTIHGAAASQFLQTLLSLQLLQAKSEKVAFNNANELMPGDDRFAIWKSGIQLKKEPKKPGRKPGKQQVKNPT